MNYINYNNCYIANVEDKIKAVSLVKIKKDENNTSFLLKDSFNCAYYYTDINSIINRITNYMNDEEIKQYINKTMDRQQLLEIIKRSIEIEKNNIIKSKEEDTKKIILKL